MTRLAWLPLGLLLASGCRDVSVCGEGRVPCFDPASDGAAGSAGAANECGPRFLNCDRTRLNGCETDSLRDFRHCGACDAVCKGVCANGSCVAFAAVASDWTADSAMALTEEFVYFAASRVGASHPVLLRLSRRDGTLITLAEGGFNEAKALAASPSRLYLLDAFTSLYSFPIEGGRFEEETGVSGSEELASVGANVAVVADGQVFVRSGDTGAWRALPKIVHASRLAGAGSYLHVAELEYGQDDLPRFTLLEHNLSSGETRSLASGFGLVSAISTPGSGLDVYFSLKASEGAEDAVLYSLEFGDVSVRQADLVGVTRWAIVDDLESPFFGDAGVISVYRRGSESGLRFSVLGRNFTREWPLPRAPEALAADGTDIYFFDTVEYDLVRVSINALLAAETAPVGE